MYSIQPQGIKFANNDSLLTELRSHQR